MDIAAATVTSDATDTGLIPVHAKDRTKLCHLSTWTIYRLCREDILPHVKIGRKIFLTRSGIEQFIAAGGER